MKFLKFLFTVVLFYALIPGVLVRLPPGASPMVVNLTHAVVFALIYSFTHKLVWRATYGINEAMYPTMHK